MNAVGVVGTVLLDEPVSGLDQNAWWGGLPDLEGSHEGPLAAG
jgi:hypothetical protein